jgi:thiol-disulfide isomerase/thioredoxin
MQQRLSSGIIRSATALATLFAFSGQTKDLPRAELVLKDLKGQRVRLSQLRGKIVVLNFWATWCGPCNAEMPMLVELEKRYSARGIVFIGLPRRTQDPFADPAVSCIARNRIPGVGRRDLR